MSRGPSCGTGRPRFPRRAAEAFHKWHYRAADQTWRANTWRGVPVHKNVADLWTLGELVHQLRPRAIVECGALHGGSALWLADCCQMAGTGVVLTIDVAEPAALPHHPRLHFYQGDTLADATRARVADFVRGVAPVLVILDDDHRAAHVLAELRAYAPLVTPGSYLIVEDTNLRHPVWPEHGPGPAEALAQWFAEDAPPFSPDPWCERQGLTFHPGGWLRRHDA